MKKIIIISVSCVLAVLVIAGVIFIPGPLIRYTAQKHLEAGNEFFNEENFDEAIREYSKVINLDRTNGDAYFGMAQAHFENGSFDAAVDVAELGYERTQHFQLYCFLEDFQENKTKKLIEWLPRYVLTAICAYNDLISTEEITAEMLDSVNALRIMVRTLSTTAPYNYEDENWKYSDIPYDASKYEYVYYLNVSINDSEFGIYGPYMRPNRYTKMINEAVEDGDEFIAKRLEAYFTLKDPGDPRWTLKDVEELLEVFPCISEFGPIYVFDTYSTDREVNWIESYMLGEGYLYPDHTEITASKTLDLSTLKHLPNLQKIEYWVATEDVESHCVDIDEYRMYKGLEFINSPVKITEKIVDGFSGLW